MEEGEEKAEEAAENAGDTGDGPVKFRSGYDSSWFAFSLFAEIALYGNNFHPAFFLYLIRRPCSDCKLAYKVHC